MMDSFRRSTEAFVYTGREKKWRAFRSGATAFVFSTQLRASYRCEKHHANSPSLNLFTPLRTIWCANRQDAETKKKTGGRCVAMCTSPRGLTCPQQIDTKKLQSEALDTAQGLYPNDLAFPSSWLE